MSSTTPSLNLCTIISESKRIIKAHSRHFLALSVLFLLPVSFSITVYPTLQQLLLNCTQNPQSLSFLAQFTSTLHNNNNNNNNQPLFLALAYVIFVSVFTLFAVGSITYSVFHGFYGRPVKLLSALRSIFTSFLPLLATTIASQIIMTGLVFVIAFFFLLVVKLVNSVGFTQFDYSSPYFKGFALLVFVALFLVLVNLQVNWNLASVVVVVESSWGLEPLKRSSSLIKGNKLVTLSFYLYYSFFTGIYFWSRTALSMYLVNSDWLKNWGFVLHIMIPSTLLTLLFLHYMAVNTVMYMYCKAIHGELAMEIAEEFAKEYVSLPFDDGKVPHLVSVSYAT
ncbi:hypothetical protein Dsin_009979 [Dipteronia sinensis]|uniref:Transmembrane protein n=1 Tax=Dipteronia sinensis TaxID=43782 RepID=A0AAE0ECF0_9ROSI|nr:hypothetical protein Dsin_009979 [Dipteronia sinensis]